MSCALTSKIRPLIYKFSGCVLFCSRGDRCAHWYPHGANLEQHALVSFEEARREVSRMICCRFEPGNFLGFPSRSHRVPRLQIRLSISSRIVFSFNSQKLVKAYFGSYSHSKLNIQFFLTSKQAANSIESQAYGVEQALSNKT